MTTWSPLAALNAGIARVPEDRHKQGAIADMSVSENVIAERYRDRRFSRAGLVDWAAARAFAQSLIDDYEVKCPSPEARIRLLSGGNMQKLIDRPRRLCRDGPHCRGRAVRQDTGWRRRLALRA